MAKRKSIGKIWHKHKSGLVVPDGISSDLSQSTSQTYLHIKEKAAAIEHLYQKNSVYLPPNSDLARWIADAKILSDSWLLGQHKNYPITLLFHTAFLDRIADAVLPLSALPSRKLFLETLVSGSLDLLKRNRSRAKDLLWELELWAMLKRMSFNAVLQEPPDIVVKFSGSVIGIACKKIYSEKHFQNVLSQAVSQIEPSFDFGIVAVNVDDLVPADQILRVRTHKELAQVINNLNGRFINTHERHFRKYLTSGRVISVLVSMGLLADVYESAIRFNNARQSLMWAIPGLPVEKDRQLSNFANVLMA